MTAAFHNDVTLYNWYEFHANFRIDHHAFLNLSVKIILPQALLNHIYGMIHKGMKIIPQVISVGLIIIPHQMKITLSFHTIKV